jgi:hypothetical protein
MPTSSAIEWIGDAHARVDGYALAPTHVLAGRATDACVRTYPQGAAAKVSLELRTGTTLVATTPMRIDADGVGPFGHDTRWCAAIAASDLVADRELAVRVVAEDAAGAPVEHAIALMPRTEIALLDDATVWRMAGPGAFVVADGVARAQPADGLGLYWPAVPTPPDFELSVEWTLDRFDDNSGVFIRFRDPDTFGYDNPAWVGVHDGLEIQIDDTARPDGADVHRTGAVYEQPGSFTRGTEQAPGVWRRFTIRVVGNRIVVALDGTTVSDVAFAGDTAHPQRALPSAPGAPRFIGLQTHSGTPSFRNVRLRAL